MEFSKPSKEDINQYLKGVCTGEEMACTGEGIDVVIDMYYPSIRRMINTLQDLKLEDRPVEPQFIQKGTEDLDKVWELIKAKKFKDVQKYIISNAIDCGDMNKYVFNFACEEELEVKAQIKLIQLCARNERDFKLGADTSIVFLASVPEMMLAIR
jgi:DNA polymerase III delta prime subunit